MFNKGAMFGLDARIALAIFGALSVISGAALYSAIQESKITQIITQLSELNKSYEAYYLDVAEDLPLEANRFAKTAELLSSDKDNWKGPYTSLNQRGSNIYSLDFKNNFWMSYSYSLDGTWISDTAGGWSAADCTTGSISGNCYVWSLISLGTSAADLALADAVDERIDGSVDHVNGKVRIFRGNPSLRYYVLIKGKKHSTL